MALKEPSKTWIKYLKLKYEAIMNCKPVSFSQLSSSDIPNRPGIYLITSSKSKREISYCVGRTKKLRTRHQQHLSGDLRSARLQKYLVTEGECEDAPSAKEFMSKHCRVRWVEEPDMRKRYALEGYITGILAPKYGISEEH